MLALYERLLTELVARPQARLHEIKESLTAWERQRRAVEEETWERSSLARFKRLKPRSATSVRPALKPPMDPFESEDQT